MYAEIHNDSDGQMQYLPRMQCKEFLCVPLRAETFQKKDWFEIIFPDREDKFTSYQY